MEEHIGTRINVTRVKQGLPLRPSVIATACPYCAVMLGDGIKALPASAPVVVRDIAELVAAAMVRTRPSG
jgi:Fe-S oxidoreductase